MHYLFHIKKKQFLIITCFLLLLPFLASVYVNTSLATETPSLFFQPCGMKTYLHLYCPGCGGTRGVYHLLRGEFITSFLCNPLVLYMFGGTIYYWLKTFFQLIRDHGDTSVDIHLGYLWIYIIILVVVFIVRNLLLVYCDIDYLGELAKYW